MQDTQETISVNKEILEHMVSDIEHLIDDIEMMIDKSSMEKIEKRLDDLKTGKVKGLTEKDLEEFMKNRK